MDRFEDYFELIEETGRKSYSLRGFIFDPIESFIEWKDYLYKFRNIMKKDIYTQKLTMLLNRRFLPTRLKGTGWGKEYSLENGYFIYKDFCSLLKNKFKDEFNIEVNNAQFELYSIDDDEPSSIAINIEKWLEKISSLTLYSEDGMFKSDSI